MSSIELTSDQQSKEELNLDQLSKDELIDHIRKQNSHINQLKNLLNKTDKSIKKNNGRKFDFTKYNKKHIALKFFYLGWNYDGFVQQENSKNTIEDHLFNALLKTHLIENRQNSNYHRCGRTDKGVSASSQVITLDLRSKLSSTGVEEIQYTRMLNKVLPKDIRCLCSAEVDSDFSARFNCKSRTYKYYFPIGKLNLELLKKAAKYLIGTHDFRNFAKLDKTKLETNYIRSIESVNINKLIDGQNNNQHLYELEIKSSAFLWHQIRNIVSVLFSIGYEKEKPELILDLLDLNKFPKKPQYNLANELPLVLFDCEFDINNWKYDEEALKDAQKSLNNFWLDSTIKSTITLQMLNNLNQSNYDYIDFFVKDLNSKNYKQFNQRQTCDTTLNENLRIKIERNLKHKLIDKSIGNDNIKIIKLDN